jgi:peptidoglycan hydrolase CwlO-like protein
MTGTNKVMIVIMLLVIITASIFYAVNNAKLARKDAEVARLQTELSECGHRVKDADNAIERQNIAIETVRVDTVYVERLIKQAEKKYVEVREVVIKSLEKDSSCENQIKNIDLILDRYHGTKLHPENNHKD